MKILNIFKSWFLIMRYARSVGAQKSEDALQALLEARRLNPKSMFVSRFLGDAYHQAGKNIEAKEALQIELNLDPNDYQLNRAMVNVLHNGGATLEEMIPYIRTALKNRATQPFKIPYGIGIFKKAKKDFEGFDKYEKEWNEWAEKVLLDYESKN